MTFPVFAPGDVLNASDMNAVGLWLVGSAAFTTTTGFNLPDNSFSSTYTNYRLMVKITATATDADFTGRLRASGTNDADAVYSTMLSGYGNNNATSDIGTAAQTSWNLGEQDTVLQFYSLVLDFFEPQLAGQTTAVGSYVFINKAVSAVIARAGAFTHNDAQAFDSFAFISTQNVTGRYWLYGYRNA